MARYLNVVTAALALTLCTPAIAPAGPAFASDILNIFPIEADPAFAHASHMLQLYAKSKSSARQNSFCVLGLTAQDKSPLAWIIWKQKNQMILWEGQDLNKVPSRRILDLKMDVVKTEADVGSSTYLVTQAWVDEIKQACVRAGTQIEFK